MIKNIQYLFKSKSVFPGPIPGQQMCIDKYLTEYANNLNINYVGVQLWEGDGEASHIVDFVIIDGNTKQMVFKDHRLDVCEYFLENKANETQPDNESTPDTSS